MTREEAIELLDNLIGMLTDNHESDYDTALKMAIKALEQEPCEDCISRHAVLNEIEKVCFGKDFVKFRIDNGSNGERDYIIKYVKEMQSVQTIIR